MSVNNPFQNAQKQLKTAWETYDASHKYIDDFAILSEPQRVLEVQVPVKMDNGKMRLFQGFRSQHNNARGPFKG